MPTVRIAFTYDAQSPKIQAAVIAKIKGCISHLNEFEKHILDLKNQKAQATEDAQSDFDKRTQEQITQLHSLPFGWASAHQTKIQVLNVTSKNKTEKIEYIPGPLLD
jgi:hypothetical protein